ncbi:MAG: hypothetical protein IT360_25520 [Gemmatimonadaceae bacterium]|nr:hypothetical protein [Gemmatimonadaceae bacterium]
MWVAKEARPDLGDSLCCIGLRAWDHAKFAVQKAAVTEYADWLSITDGSAHFVFKLDMMPIRFCRGDSEKPLPPKYAVADVRERAQTELAFSSTGHPTVEGVFRFVVEADALGAPLGVVLVHANLQGETMMAWRIPREEDGRGVAPIVVPQSPIELPALELQTVDEAEAAERERLEREKAEEGRAARIHNEAEGA